VVDVLATEYGTERLSRNFDKNTTNLHCVILQKRADFIYLVAEAMGWRVRDRTTMGQEIFSSPYPF